MLDWAPECIAFCVMAEDFDFFWSDPGDRYRDWRHALVIGAWPILMLASGFFL